MDPPLIVENVDWNTHVLVEDLNRNTDSYYEMLLQLCARNLDTAVYLQNQQAIRAPARRIVQVVAQKRRGTFLIRLKEDRSKCRLMDEDEAIARIATDLHHYLAARSATLVTPVPPANNNHTKPPTKKSTAGAKAKSTSGTTGRPKTKTGSSTPKKAQIQASVTQRRILTENERLADAVRLLMMVCQACSDGKSDLEAIRCLDQPTSSEETPRQQKMRMALRHRFIAVVRAKKKCSILKFSQTLMKAWGIELDIKDECQSPVKREHKQVLITEHAAPQGRKLPHPLPRGLNPKFLRLSIPVYMKSGQYLFSDYVKGGSGANAALLAVAPSASSAPPVKHTKKVWEPEEKRAFLKGLEKHPVGRWKEILPFVETRYVTTSKRMNPCSRCLFFYSNLRQVAAYGCRLANRFNLKRGDFPTPEVRKYLGGGETL